MTSRDTKGQVHPGIFA